MPSVQRVREWYEQSFVEIRRSRQPVDAETEAEFFELISNVYERHAPTLITMARGVHELKQSLVTQHGDEFEFGDLTSIHSFLDKFYMSRIGIRILIGQYIELRREPQLEGYVGLINLATSPAEIFQQAMEDAKYMCERAHGDARQRRRDPTGTRPPPHCEPEHVRRPVSHGVCRCRANQRLVIAITNRNAVTVPSSRARLFRHRWRH